MAHRSAQKAEKSVCWHPFAEAIDIDSLGSSQSHGANENDGESLDPGLTPDQGLPAHLITHGMLILGFM